MAGIQTGTSGRIWLLAILFPPGPTAVSTQRTDDFLHALTCCLHHLGGSPKILVTDNLKASVIKADRYEPGLNRIMEDFANHYGFAVIPARVRSPKDKAYVKFFVM